MIKPEFLKAAGSAWINEGKIKKTCIMNCYNGPSRKTLRDHEIIIGADEKVSISARKIAREIIEGIFEISP